VPDRDAATTLKWRELDPARRKGIARAVRAGRAVDDPRDAPYAVAFADWQLGRLSVPRRRILIFHGSLLVLFLTSLVLSGRPSFFALLPLLFPAAAFVTAAIWVPRFRTRAREAKTANERLGKQMGLHPVGVDFPGSGYLRRADSIQRRFIVIVAVVVGVFVAIAIGVSIASAG